MLVSKALYLSPLFRASFGNHGLGEWGPLRHPYLGLHQDPGIWLWLHRFPQPALWGYQANCKHLPMDSSITGAMVRLWHVYIKPWTVLSASHCHSRVWIPGDPIANVFAMSWGEMKQFCPFQDWFLGNSKLCLPANLLCGVLFNSCLVQLHCSPVKLEITILFLILCTCNRYAWLFP